MLKLSISNISWDSKYDQEIYKYLLIIIFRALK